MNSAVSSVPERLQRVLHAIVELYTETNQPVASRAVSAQPGLRLSPAAVRAQMAELMEAGFLAQPHASAGRVPTDLAFRAYVASIAASPTRLSPQLAVGLHRAEDADDYLCRVADLLGDATGQLGFFVSVAPDEQCIDRIHFVRVSAERVMALIVAPGGVVRSRVVAEADCDQRTLDRISQRLSGWVAGCTLPEARARVAAQIDHTRERRNAEWRKLIALGSRGLAAEGAELYVGDRNPLLGQPDFDDIERLRDILAALEEKERMLRLLDGVVRADQLQVVIGDELSDPAMRSCAVVAARIEGPRGGGLGVIGPVRMRYDRVIPLVCSVCERVSERSA